MVIGITGGVGSGKSTVTDLLSEKYGFRVLRTDDLAKELEQPGQACYKALAEAFGDRILEPMEEVSGAGTACGARPIDKGAFAALIYSDSEAMARAEEIIHPAVWDEVEQKLKAEPEVSFAVETALPSERFRGFCDEIWYVYAETGKRIRRLMETRGYSEEKCTGIIREQIGEEEYAAYADHIIDNSGEMQETEARIAELLEDPE